MSFCVVEFTEDSAIEVMPSQWLKPDQKSTYWPSCNRVKLKKALQGEYDLRVGKWDVYNVRVLLFADSYNKGRAKVRQMESASNCEASEEEPAKKNRCFEIVSVSQENYIVLPENEDLHRAVIQAPPSFQEQSSSVMNTEDNVVSKDESFQEQILRKIDDILCDIVFVKEAVLNIASEKLCREIKSMQMIAAKLPIKKDEELEELEKDLDNEENKLKMIEYLSKVGGGTYKDATYLIMKKVLINEMAAKFSYCGKKGKFPFNGLNISSVVVNAVMSRFKNITQKDIELRIGTFLATAIDRNGGRRNRGRKSTIKAEE